MKRKAEPSADEPPAMRAWRNRVAQYFNVSRVPFHFYLSTKLDEFEGFTNKKWDPKQSHANWEYEADHFIDGIINWINTNTGQNITKGPAFQKLKEQLPHVTSYDIIDAVYLDYTKIQDEFGPSFENLGELQEDAYLSESKIATNSESLFNTKDFPIEPDVRKDFNKAANKLKHIIPAMKVGKGQRELPEGQTIAGHTIPLSKKGALRHGTTWDNDDEVERETVSNDLYSGDD